MLQSQMYRRGKIISSVAKLCDLHFLDITQCHGGCSLHGHISRDAVRLELNLDMFLSLNLCKVPPQLYCDGVTIILTFVLVAVVLVDACEKFLKDHVVWCSWTSCTASILRLYNDYTMHIRLYISHRHRETTVQTSWGARTVITRAS